MVQLRYIGNNEPLTKSNMLLVSKSITQARVIEGFNCTLTSTGTEGELLLLLQPGMLIMPDGMIYRETEEVRVPFSIGNSIGPYQGTLIAEKGDGRSSIDNVLSYTMVVGNCLSDTLPSESGRIRIPLAFINKNSGIPKPSNFNINNIGSRSRINKNLQMNPPIPLINSVGEVSKTLLESDKLCNQIPVGSSYLPVGNEDDFFISSVVFDYFCTNRTRIKVSSLRKRNEDSKTKQYEIIFEPGNGIGIFPYPTGSNVSRDTLLIETDYIDSDGNTIPNNTSLNPVILFSVIVNRQSIFSLI